MLIIGFANTYIPTAKIELQQWEAVFSMQSMRKGYKRGKSRV
jgi:hypothetical protein